MGLGQLCIAEVYEPVTFLLGPQKLRFRASQGFCASAFGEVSSLPCPLCRPFRQSALILEKAFLWSHHGKPTGELSKHLVRFAASGMPRTHFHCIIALRSISAP